MASTASNKLKFLLASKIIDFKNDSFKIILMASGYVFDKDADEGYANLTAGDKLGDMNGYLANTKVLAGAVVTEDDVNDRCSVTWTNVTWTASGGVIGPTPGAIIYDDTVVAAGVTIADPIIGYIDFGGDQTQADGGAATISNIEIRIE